MKKAIATAQTASLGEIDEVDLEDLNIDVCGEDAKVDSATGAGCGTEFDH